MFTFLGRYYCPTEQLIILKPRTKQNLPEKVTKLNSPYSARGETWILIKKSKEDWLEACFDTVSCNLKHWCFHNEFVLWSGFFYLYIYMVISYHFCKLTNPEITTFAWCAIVQTLRLRWNVLIQKHTLCIVTQIIPRAMPRWHMQGAWSLP